MAFLCEENKKIFGNFIHEMRAGGYIKTEKVLKELKHYERTATTQPRNIFLWLMVICINEPPKLLRVKDDVRW